MVVWALLCHSCGFPCQQRVLKTFSGPDYLSSENGVVWLWHSLVNLYIWLTISSSYGYILLTLGLIGRYGSLRTLVSDLQICLPAEGVKKVSWPWLSALRGWGSPNMAFSGKFKCMAHHFMLLRLNSSYLSVDREGWLFEHSSVIVSGLLVNRGC